MEKICSDKTREKLRNRDVTEKQLDALLNRDRKHNEDTKIKMRNNIHGSAKKPIKIEIDGIKYDSYNDASRKLKIPLSTLFRRYKNNKV